LFDRTHRPNIKIISKRKIIVAPLALKREKNIESIIPFYKSLIELANTIKPIIVDTQALVREFPNKAEL
jgi:hypothetical protein